MFFDCQRFSILNIYKFEICFNIMNKRGQMHLSFGMIFSIILIIAFVAFASYGIVKLLAFQQSAKYHQFIDELSSDTDKIWKSTQGSQEFAYTLPSSLKGICFVKKCDASKYYCRTNSDNLVFLNSKNKFESYFLEHLDISGSLGSKSELCFNSSGTSIKLKLFKNYNEALVKVSKI